MASNSSSTTTTKPSSSSSSPTKAPLAELSPNTNTPTSPTKPSHSSTTNNAKDENAIPHHPHPHPHPQLGKQDQQTYISPSDTIMSPTTKKLSAIKGRRFARPQEQKSLFAKTVGKQHQALQNSEVKNTRVSGGGGE